MSTLKKIGSRLATVGKAVGTEVKGMPRISQQSQGEESNR